jgi:hypothetical protein
MIGYRNCILVGEIVAFEWLEEEGFGDFGLGLVLLRVVEETGLRVHCYGVLDFSVDGWSFRIVKLF